jgi:adenylosuccinate lyase
MNHTSLQALSPLDGRYAQKLALLRPIMSEYGYMHRRVQVEITWLIALSHAKLPEFKPFSSKAIDYLESLVRDFSLNDANAIKDIEKTTNHDVKAVEYWIKARLQDEHLAIELKQEFALILEFVHFSLTSEDVNNTSHALQIQAAKEQALLPMVDALIDTLSSMSAAHAEVAMLSKTHGQTATPTTVGKEMANFVRRLERARRRLAAVSLMGKINGAVGNYNAQVVAYPEVDWPSLTRHVVQTKPSLDEHSKLEHLHGLGLTFQDYSTQIEPHDYMGEFFDALAHINVILIDCSRDIWGYISAGYFKQRLKAGEIGSSTMPHKVNPIDFENAEGNLGLANALLKHMGEKLPISRFQRDLSDSTVIRNIGVAFGYSVLAYQSLQTGFNKLEINPSKLMEDLELSWEVLAEPIQTVMRRYGVSGAYEQLKEVTRGQVVLAKDLHALIERLDIPQEAKNRLLALTPWSYTGLASTLAHQMGPNQK